MKNYYVKSAHPIVYQSLLESHQARLHVNGGSMQPFIQRGDWVVIEPVKAPEMLKKGEIILFSRGNEFVIHRIIKLEDEKIITRGDWTRIKDPPISHNDVVGKVIEIEKTYLKIKLTNPFFRLINFLYYQIIRNF
jgi:signal peptidase I